MTSRLWPRVRASFKSITYFFSQSGADRGTLRRVSRLDIAGGAVLAMPMGEPVALRGPIRGIADQPDLCRLIVDGGCGVFRQEVTLETIADRFAPVVEAALRAHLTAAY